MNSIKDEKDTFQFFLYIETITMYWIVRKVRADVEGNVENLNFSIHLLNI